VSPSPSTLTAQEVSELRHELRTPINHIVGYAEMLLEDLPAADTDGRRVALEETLVVARGALDLINGALAGSAPGGVLAAAEITSLFDSLRAPQERIVGVVAPLLAGASGEAELAADLRRILTAAEKLVPAEAGEAAAPGETEVEQSAAEAGADGEPGPARILVVDDVEANRDLLRRRLEREGHAVECAEDGQRALEAIRARGYDLVLLDVMMPEIDGYRRRMTCPTSCAASSVGRRTSCRSHSTRCCCAPASVHRWRRSGCATTRSSTCARSTGSSRRRARWKQATMRRARWPMWPPGPTSWASWPACSTAWSPRCGPGSSGCTTRSGT
jgi:hypothetical protein